jgi:hypothetical protein
VPERRLKELWSEWLGANDANSRGYSCVWCDGYSLEVTMEEVTRARPTGTLAVRLGDYASMVHLECMMVPGSPSARFWICGRYLRGKRQGQL